MKPLFLILICTCFVRLSVAQSALGPAEKKITDSLCDCISKVDISKINTSKEAYAVFTDCFSKQTSLLTAVAEEKSVSLTDDEAMNKIGIEIGKNLFKQNCGAALKLGVKMAQKDNDQESSENNTEGVFKRIESKGFNYIILSGKNNNETSFIWLRQFPGSENFMADTVKYVGKKIRIKYHELEVFLPAAKGYYKVKEITAIEIL